jgi:hypothetical protein
MVIENILAQLAYAYSHAGNAHQVPAALISAPESRSTPVAGVSLASFIAERHNPNLRTERR